MSGVKSVLTIMNYRQLKALARRADRTKGRSGKDGRKVRDCGAYHPN
jgi:hypothetical protein